MVINKIFWDIDETLIHTRYSPGKHGEFKEICVESEDGSKEILYTSIRPCSLELIEFSRGLVGKENVHILTTATYDYALHISKLAGWGFGESDIFSRGVIEQFTIEKPMMYGSESLTTPHPLSHPGNLLIDNLPAQLNMKKIFLMGIPLPDGYLEVPDYVGINSTEEYFKNLVINFLNAK